MSTDALGPTNQEVTQTAIASQEEALNQLYSYAAHLLVQEKRAPGEVVDLLADEGLGRETAVQVVDNLQEQIKAAKKKAANNDMLYGALWFVGGTVATLVDIGYIFWGGNYNRRAIRRYRC